MESITKTELVCSTPAEADVTGASFGSRGLLYEVWTATEDPTASDTSAADYHSMTMDGSDVEGPYFNETNGFTAKLSGFFVAPYTGNISFYLESSDAATLSLSADSDPANVAVLVENTEATTSNSDPVALVKGELYYMEVVHVQAASSAEENRVKVSLWEHQTNWHESQTSLAKDEEQVLYWDYERVFETQAITFTGMSGVSDVTANTSATATPMPLARRRPMLASLDSIGSANATRDGLATESSAWTATAHSAPSPASKSR